MDDSRSSSMEFNDSLTLPIESLTYNYESTFQSMSETQRSAIQKIQNAIDITTSKREKINITYEENDEVAQKTKKQVKDYINNLKGILDNYVTDICEDIYDIRDMNESKIDSLLREILNTRKQLKATMKQLTRQKFDDKELDEICKASKVNQLSLSTASSEENFIMNMNVIKTPFYRSLNHRFQRSALLTLSHQTPEDFVLELLTNLNYIVVGSTVKCRVIVNGLITHSINDTLYIYVIGEKSQIHLSFGKCISSNEFEFRFRVPFEGSYSINALFAETHIRKSPIVIVINSTDSDVNSSIIDYNNFISKDSDILSSNEVLKGKLSDTEESLQFEDSDSLNYNSSKEIFTDKRTFTPINTPKSKIGTRFFTLGQKDNSHICYKSHQKSIIEYLKQNEGSFNMIINGVQCWKKSIKEPLYCTELSISGNIVICTKRKTLYLLTSEGQFIKNIETKNLVNPSNFTALDDDYFAFIDGNKDIYIFDETSQLVREHTLLGCMGLTTDRFGNLITLLSITNGISILFLDIKNGDTIKRVDVVYSDKFSDITRLHYKGRRLFAVFDGRQVHVFSVKNKTGNILHSLPHPVGIGTDRNGNILIAEGNGLQVFDKRAVHLAHCLTNKALRRLTDFTFNSTKMEFIVISMSDEQLIKFKFRK